MHRGVAPWARDERIVASGEKACDEGQPVVAATGVRDRRRRERLKNSPKRASDYNFKAQPRFGRMRRAPCLSLVGMFNAVIGTPCT